MAVPPEVHPVAGSPVDAKFADAIPQELAVSEVAELEPFKPDQNTGLRLAIPEARKPFRKRFLACCGSIAPDLEHGLL